MRANPAGFEKIAVGSSERATNAFPNARERAPLFIPIKFADKQMGNEIIRRIIFFN